MCKKPEVIQRLVEMTNMVRKSSASKASGRIAINSLRESTMKEGVLHIQLMNRSIL
jgi:hypothetical protein